MATLNLPEQIILDITKEAQIILSAKNSGARVKERNDPVANSELPLMHSYAKVQLKNGKSFSGEVLSGPEENVLRIKTMIGIIGIRKTDIKSYRTE
jgi:hypothetical protein